MTDPETTQQVSDDELNQMRLGIPGSYSTGKIAAMATALIASRKREERLREALLTIVDGAGSVSWRTVIGWAAAALEAVERDRRLAASMGRHKPILDALGPHD